MGTTTSAPIRAHLLDWADREHPIAAAHTRAVEGRPEVYGRYVARLDELWWQWAAGIWAGWPSARWKEHDARFEELVRGGTTPRDAEREAFLERTEGGAAA